MNEIDIIIIVNILGVLTIAFFVYKWYKTLLETYGRKVALLLPIALIGFLGAIGRTSENDAKRISKNEISKALRNQKLKENKFNVKRISFVKDVSLLQKLDIYCEVGLDSLTNDYRITKEISVVNSGISSNFDWTDFTTNFVKINDSIYDFKISAYYDAKILFIVNHFGEKKVTKRINIKNY